MLFLSAMRLELYLEDFLLMSEDNRVWTEEWYKTSKMTSRIFSDIFRWIWTTHTVCMCEVSMLPLWLV